MKPLDVLIVGCGPIGIACGLEAQKNGLDYLIIEKGCLVNSIYNYPVNMRFFSSSDLLEIEQIPFISKEVKPNRDEALEYYRRIVSSNNLRVNLFEGVTQVEKTADAFEVITTKDVYFARNVIIATGFYDIPNYIGVKGESLPKVAHYYKDPHFYAHQNVAVIGASNSSVDAALECYRKGAHVTMIVRGDSIGRRVKYWVKPDIENRIAEGSIKAYFNSEVAEITENFIRIETPDGSVTLDNDYVLALTGYEPNFEFLESMGIQLSEDERRKPFYNEETMETNTSGLYLAGVICGGMETHKWFIENSRVHAKQIVNHIQSKQQ
ncbi:MAG: YpdA family putative bacillithiol disulfide reductase [Flavobacteriaceae bacterium]|nr:YpdA family putative bacillithiol disulfide reductase [Flavobacteriaceae bacterium]